MPPDRDLDRELQDLGPHVEYPPAPDLARSVRERLQAENAGTDAPARPGPRLWWIAAAALALLVAVPVFATVANNLGGAFSGGTAGSAGGGAAQGGGRGDAADVVEPTQPPLAMESGSSATSAEAVCGSLPPALEARPARGAPGGEFSIRGRGFDGNLRDCNNDPARNVRVEFLQDGRSWGLGRLASDENSRLAAELQVPPDARPGRATVRATFGQGPPDDPYGRQSAEARFFVTE